MKFQLKSGVALIALCVSVPIYAQDASPRTAERDDLAEIVVTGTLIRGVAPTGTETILVTADDIKEAGGLSTNDALARVPQITNFFNTQIVAAPGQPHGIDTPAIHGLPTLILLDGQRIAAAGTFVTSVDPSIIPKGLLQQIEIVPDGGSALYGSDAVGGVINMTTKKKIDGVDVDGNVGFANAYQSYRLDVEAGKSWSDGSVYLAYAFDKQTPLFGFDRGYLQRIPPLTECYPGTVTVSEFNLATFTNNVLGQFSYPGVGANGKPTAYTTGAAACNEYTHASVTPEEHMNSVFAGLSQDLGSAVRLDVRAFYSSRPSTTYNTFNTYTDGQVPKTNFYYTPTAPELAPGSLCAFLCSQSAGISFAPAVGSNIVSSTELETYGVSSDLTADVGRGFQVRLLGSFSESQVHSTAIGVDSGLLATSLAGGTAATALDPYYVAASPQSITLAREIDDQQTYTEGRTQLTQGRLVADGPLLHIPGGDVKIAVGGEFLHETYSSQVVQVTYDGGTYSPTQTTDAARTVSSAFGEIDIPFLSPDNKVPLLYSLKGSLAGRFDHYSDFGNTTDPRFALSYMPVEWLTIRATDGRSFLAPALTQEFSAQSGFIVPGIPFLLPPGDTADAFKNLIILTGGNPGLKPQTAKTYTFGGDLTVPSIDGLKASITYYHALFNNQIATAPFTSPSVFYTPTYAPFYLRNPSYAAASALIGNTPVSGNGFTSLAQMYGPGGGITPASPVIIADARFNNLAIVRTDGLDFDASYKHPTSFGALNFDVAGNYVLNNDASPVAGAAFTDELLTSARFYLSVSAGANIHDLRVNANVLHTGGYGLTPGVSPYGQTYVKPYNTVNAFFNYTLRGSGMIDGTELSLSVNNILDTRPPVNTAVSLGYSAGSIIGRTVSLGVHKKF
jgi:iron complex outermembrane recepter protein